MEEMQGGWKRCRLGCSMEALVAGCAGPGVCLSGAVPSGDVGSLEVALLLLALAPARGGNGSCVPRMLGLGARDESSGFGGCRALSPQRGEGVGAG
jgi:hypothetical protein